MKRIALIIVMIIVGLVGLSFLFTQPLDSKNTITVQGHFQRIEQIEYKGDLSYNIYIQEKSDYYKISADDVDCFLYDDFKNTVQEGQLIKISVTDNSFLMKPFCLL